jgi:hypothetical protein
MAMKLVERVEADLLPKPKKTALKKRAASPEASGSGTGNSFLRNVRGRGGSEPGYNFIPGRTRIREGGGSRVSNTAAAAAAADEAAAVEAAEAGDEAVLPTTNIRAQFLHNRCQVKAVVVVHFFCNCRVYRKNF